MSDKTYAYGEELFDSALREYYTNHAVDSSIDARLNHWMIFRPANFSHNLSDEEKVRMYELDWLHDKFPLMFNYY